MRWPGRVPAGRVDPTSVLSGVDLLPTLLAAAHVPPPAGYESDGVNLLPAFRGEAFPRAKPIFWEWRGNHAKEANWPELAVREGDWGLLMTENGRRVELYDVIKDRAQQDNRAAAQPERVAALIRDLRAWKATLPPTKPQTGGAAAPSRPPRKKGATAAKKTTTPTNRPAPDRAATFARWDTNHDGVLSREEYRDGLSNSANAANRFRNFDRNGDGRLSREEFVTPAAK